MSCISQYFYSLKLLKPDFIVIISVPERVHIPSKGDEARAQKYITA